MSEMTQDRDPKRKLTYEEDNNEGTGPNLLPDVGVFATAGPSGVAKKATSEKPNANATPTQAPGNEPQSSPPESKKPKICLYVKFKNAPSSGEAPGKF